jgi:hypothetical protein
MESSMLQKWLELLTGVRRLWLEYLQACCMEVARRLLHLWFVLFKICHIFSLPFLALKGISCEIKKKMGIGIFMCAY